MGKRQEKNVEFEVDRRAVLHSLEIGGGYAALQKLCTVFSIPPLYGKTFSNINKVVCDALAASAEATLDMTGNVVKKE